MTLKNNIIYLSIIILFIIFAYFGFFPFNISETRHIHYFIYDNIHLAFNISNNKYKGNNYYCSPSYKISEAKSIDRYRELDNLLSKYKSELAQINRQIKESPAYQAIDNAIFRYGLTKFDVNRLQQLQSTQKKLEKQIYDIEEEQAYILDEHFNKCKLIVK